MDPDPLFPLLVPVVGLAIFLAGVYCTRRLINWLIRSDDPDDLESGLRPSSGYGTFQHPSATTDRTPQHRPVAGRSARPAPFPTVIDPQPNQPKAHDTRQPAAPGPSILYSGLQSVPPPLLPAADIVARPKLASTIHSIPPRPHPVAPKTWASNPVSIQQKIFHVAVQPPPNSNDSRLVSKYVGWPTPATAPPSPHPPILNRRVRDSYTAFDLQPSSPPTHVSPLAPHPPRAVAAAGVDFLRNDVSPPGSKATASPRLPPTPISPQSTRLNGSTVLAAEEYRARASDQAALMKKAFKDRDSAHARGQKKLAREFSRLGKSYQARMKAFNEKAERIVFAENNKDLKQGLIDLHGLHKDEARRRAKQNIEAAQKRGDLTIQLIVGKGLHSDSGVGNSVIRPAVEELLSEMKLSYKVSPRNEGRLVVSLSGSR